MKDNNRKRVATLLECSCQITSTKGETLMYILNKLQLKSNSKINFDSNTVSRHRNAENYDWVVVIEGPFYNIFLPF